MTLSPPVQHPRLAGTNVDDGRPSRGSTPQSRRLPTGGLIDRAAPLAFAFDGTAYAGYGGDTLASALLANGVRLVGRSFKYHRPRGIVSAGSEEPNALVELRNGARREPNTRATTAELYDGLTAASQNRWPSLAFDLMAVNGLIAPALAAGFYYKTFMWPSAFWERVYEPLIRRAAGLGRAAAETDPDTYEKATAHCDVLIIGAGPAGLMAALAAGRAGARVILADEGPRPGGRLLADRRCVADTAGEAWACGVMAELSAMPEVVIMPRTTVFGAYDHGTFGAIERVADHMAIPPAHMPRQRLWRVIARQSVVAAGATERPIAFGNNDRPGVMLAGAVRTYINRFAVTPGAAAVVFTNNDDGASTIADLIAANVRVEAIVDTRAQTNPLARQLADRHGIRVVTSGAITDAHGALAVSGARVAGSHGIAFECHCDLIAVSGGWNPNIALTTHLGGRPVWNEALAAFVPGARPKGMAVAGSANGAFALGDCLAEGARAGAAAAEAAGFAPSHVALPAVEGEATAVSAFWHVTAARHKAFVDFQNDVAVSDIAIAEREGFRAVEHMKRYTTLGMATDQGRTANVNGLAILAALTGKTIAATGITTARPPYTPVTLGALAGHHTGRDFKPTRLPPSHAWAKEHGAVFVETGLWLRSAYFPRAGETDWLATVTREVETVRTTVGVCDVSTLGKIDVQGPDAAALLDKLYANAMGSLAVGRARYGLMLREDGLMMDDGTVARLAADRYFVTTTTANAARVLQHMEFCHQWLWPQFDVQITAATEQWAQYAIAGPRSADLLAAIADPGTDLSDGAFPYMAAGEIAVCGGVRARLYRLSFSGERAYEIGVPAGYGDGLMRRLMAAGQAFGACAYGVEALGVMRIEKGHIGGAEINGTTTPADLGLARMVSTRKDFVGRVLGARPGLVDPNRPALVGLRPVEATARLRAGAHFVARAAPATAASDEGYMTSVAFSPTAGRWIGLGLLARGAQRIGEVIRAVDPVRGGEALVEVVAPVFVDPTGERLRG